jgi:DNA-binding MarR family transcriptional regulator
MNEDPNLSIAIGLRRSLTRLGRRLRAERSGHALSANKLCVLSYLYSNHECSPGEVAAAEHLQPQSLSKLLAELEAEGLTVRSKNSHDGRQSILKITQKGKGLLRRDMSERDVWLASAISGISETEAQLLQIASRIMEQLADHSSGSSKAIRGRV